MVKTMVEILAGDEGRGYAAQAPSGEARQGGSATAESAGKG